MISKSLTSQEIIFIHQIIEENFGLPRGHIKIGDIETLLQKIEGVPFTNEEFDVFTQASYLFEGIIRLHFFTDGNKRTALETTRQFLNRNGRDFVVPLSGTNYIYKIARDKTRETDKLVEDISIWLQIHSPKIQEWYKIRGLLFWYLQAPVWIVTFFSKIKLNRISKYFLHKYLSNEDPKVTEFMLSIYEKQLNLFELSEKQFKENMNKKSEN